VGPLHITEMVEARNFKLGMQITRGANEQNAKLGQKDQVEVTWPTFAIFGPP